MTDAMVHASRSNPVDDTCPICGRPADTCPAESRVFYVRNLDCAHCAAEMEERIAALPRMNRVDLTYTTRQLRVTCPHPEEMRLKFQEVCQAVDDDVAVLDLEDDALLAAQTVSAKSGIKGWEPDAKRDLTCIIIAAVVFVIGLFLEYAGLAMPGFAAPFAFLVAYAVVGGEVLLHAARNIRKGQVFDENFLMSVATFGAIAVQQFPEAVGVMLFYRVGELFENRAVERSRSQIIDAVDMRPETVGRLVDYQVESVATAPDGTVTDQDARARAVEVVPAETAQVGDYLLVRPGERIPLDGMVVEGASRLDVSPVTGEPVPVSVEAGSAVVSGCVNTSGMLVMRVDRPLSESMVTRILDSVENASANKPQIQRFITRFARIYTPAVIAVAVATAVIPSLVTGDWARWVYTACTFLVISCPCAIVLSVPLSFFTGIGAASKLGILFKGGDSIEALHNVRAVVMDKTGTITKGVFAVQSIDPASGFTGSDVLRIAAGAELVSTHPIAASIVAAARGLGLGLDEPTDVRETAGKGIDARFRIPDGAERRVLCGNRALLQGAAIDVPVAAAGGFPGTCVLVAIEGEYAGRIAISDEVKPDSAAAIAAIGAQGIQSVMLTGDGEEAARSIAAQVGVDEVRARLLPEGKVDELLAVRERYGAVMFVGDGINDAPVLAGADVGCAMGSGSDAAIEAADVVFMTSSLVAVPQSLRIAKAVAAIATQNIVFALVVKAAVMVLGFAGLASMWAAVFADVGVTMICILNSIRLLHRKY
jgi:Cd2+/Zn2+-exporting ATPase